MTHGKDQMNDVTVNHADSPGGAQQADDKVQRNRLRLFWDLLLTLTRREISIRYKQSMMGLFWALLMPCLVVLAGIVLRAAMAKMTNTPLVSEQVGAILVKSLPWAFAVGAIRFATASFTSNSNLVTRANCPRVVFPLSAVLASLFDTLVALVPLAIVLAIVGIPVTWQVLWAIPLLALLVLLVTGLGIGLATLNLFYRDVKYIVEVLLTFAIFFTPVFYDTAMLGDWGFWVLLNPISPLLEGLHSSVVLGRMPDLAWVAYSAVVTLVLTAGALAMFRRLEPVFADCI